jgi:hypothetical protein
MATGLHVFLSPMTLFLKGSHDSYLADSGRFVCCTPLSHSRSLCRENSVPVLLSPAGPLHPVSVVLRTGSGPVLWPCGVCWEVLGPGAFWSLCGWLSLPSPTPPLPIPSAWASNLISYPATAAIGGAPVAFARPTTLDVVVRPTVVDTTSWKCGWWTRRSPEQCCPYALEQLTGQSSGEMAPVDATALILGIVSQSASDASLLLVNFHLCPSPLPRPDSSSSPCRRVSRGL